MARQQSWTSTTLRTPSSADRTQWEGGRKHRSGDSQAMLQPPDLSARFRPQWGFPGGAALSVPSCSGTTEEGSASQAVCEQPLLRERRSHRAWFLPPEEYLCTSCDGTKKETKTGAKTAVSARSARGMQASNTITLPHGFRRPWAFRRSSRDPCQAPKVVVQGTPRAQRQGTLHRPLGGTH